MRLPGIFRDSPTHLRKLGAGEFERGRVQEIVQCRKDGRCHSPLRSGQEVLVGGDGLTCLSVRCLSSYLIFSASSSDQQAAGEARPGHATARADDTRASHISPLVVKRSGRKQPARRN